MNINDLINKANCPICNSELIQKFYYHSCEADLNLFSYNKATEYVEILIGINNGMKSLAQIVILNNSLDKFRFWSQHLLHPINLNQNIIYNSTNFEELTNLISLKVQYTFTMS